MFRLISYTKAALTSPSLAPRIVPEPSARGFVIKTNCHPVGHSVTPSLVCHFLSGRLSISGLNADAARIRLGHLGAAWFPQRAVIRPLSGRSLMSMQGSSRVLIFPSKQQALSYATSGAPTANSYLVPFLGASAITSPNIWHQPTQLGRMNAPTSSTTSLGFGGDTTALPPPPPWPAICVPSESVPESESEPPRCAARFPFLLFP